MSPVLNVLLHLYRNRARRSWPG